MGHELCQSCLILNSSYSYFVSFANLFRTHIKSIYVFCGWKKSLKHFSFDLWNTNLANNLNKYLTEEKLLNSSIQYCFFTSFDKNSAESINPHSKLTHKGFYSRTLHILHPCVLIVYIYCLDNNKKKSIKVNVLGFCYVLPDRWKQSNIETRISFYMMKGFPLFHTFSLCNIMWMWLVVIIKALLSVWFKIIQTPTVNFDRTPYPFCVILQSDKWARCSLFFSWITRALNGFFHIQMKTKYWECNT